MIFVWPFAHIPAGLAENGRRGHYIDAIDLGQVRTAQVKQPGTQVKLWLIPLRFLEPPLALFFRQRGTVAAILSLLKILLKLSLTLRHLLPRDVPAGALYQIIPLPPVRPHRANLLRRPKGISQ